MFGWFKKKQAEPRFPLAEMRETLFGDRPLHAWTGNEPWNCTLARRRSTRSPPMP